MQELDTSGVLGEPSEKEGGKHVLDAQISSNRNAATDSIATLQHYRAWVIWRIPSIRFFDYQKVKDVERKAASKLFGTEETPTALASKVGNPDIYPV